MPLLITPFDVPGLAGFTPRVLRAVTGHLDILPTLVELAGGEVPPEARGQSLLRLMRGADDGAAAGAVADATRRGVASEYHSNLGSTGAFAWMSSDGRWKLITFGHTLPWFSEAAGYTAQLFDLASDHHAILTAV